MENNVLNKRGYISLIRKLRLIYPLDTKDIKKLIDKIVIWYNIKYPDNYILSITENGNNGNYYLVSEAMNIERLIYTLTEEEKELMNCFYKSKEQNIKTTYDNNINNVSNSESYFYLYDYNTYPYKPEYKKIIYYDIKTGIINKNKSNRYIFNSNGNVYRSVCTIKELLEAFRKSNEKKIGYTNLVNIVDNYKTSKDARNFLIELIIAKLNNNPNSDSVCNSFRVFNFKKEINEYICRLEQFKEQEIIKKKELKLSDM